ncbi:DHH family phosphoesterase [Methanobrevibacter curvatus]|uniref:General stress protein 13 n=1 Tax=Methanobrevibacter curvatus TaxID=49547 RepID=A0A165ZDC3_9EURY|nr:DHH family phosphoesterase [Methanobrevibacter curvatus]KZX10566.1 general stress protein 13 [Methanobrevibacter curvatus]
MESKCPHCKGKGKIAKETKVCPKCNGSGYEKSFEIKDQFKGVNSKSSAKFDLESEHEVPCKTCKGKGKVSIVTKCTHCKGTGTINQCKICGKVLEKGDLCGECEMKEKEIQIAKEKEAKKLEKKTVFALDGLIEMSDLEIGPVYKGKISRTEKYGAFVSLNNNVWGLMRIRNHGYEVGEEVFVKVTEIKLKERQIDLKPMAVLGKYNLKVLKKNINRTKIENLQSKLGKMTKIQGEIIQIQQTSGPTIFIISDETSICEIAAFNEAGVRVYPELDVGDIVNVIGEVNERNGQIQIESESIESLSGEDEEKIRIIIDNALDERSTPEEVEFLIKSDILDKLKPKIYLAAKKIKRAILDGRSILVRHHADADGITAGIAMEKAVIPILNELNPSSDSQWHYFKRSPSKAPFYELEDVVKDLSFALEDRERHGQKLPLIVLLDNGSTEEDVLALMKAKIYDIEIVVIDHHFPGEVIDGKVEVDEYVDVHVNPYLVGGDSQLTAGALSTEVAHVLNPKIKDLCLHLPAIAALGDHASSKEADQYIELASEKGYTKEDLDKIAACVDFEAYYLRFMNGRGIMDTIIGVGNIDKHEKLVDALFKEYNKRVETQLKATLPNLKTERFDNDLIFNQLDVEKYAHRFTFPAPGKTCGFVHDSVVKKNGEDKTILTLSYGPDFAVIRATEKVNKVFGFNLNEIIKILAEKIPNAGIDGGGHEVAGSIKFLEGLSDEVLNTFKEELKGMTPK